MSDAAAGVRLDLWLWAARFFKTRQLAKQAIDGGKVEFDRHAVKAAKAVHVGDRLTVVREQERFEIEVLGLSSQRGPASAAQAMYAESDESRLRREAERERRRMERAGMQPPETRPDKRARRLIRALGDIDAM
jgi:ribosome-associated heat shock protein Hsp15